jgi:hypothetical protein
MSLINDALQRAKTVQQIHPPPVADLPLRPIEPAQQQTRGPGLVLPATLATVLLTGFFSWWLLNRTTHAAKAPETTPAIAASVASAPIVSSPAPGKAIEPPATIPTKAADPVAAATATNASARGAAAVNEPAATVEVAKPASPKLQAITFNPARPSAIVSGKTVYVGDRFREFRVVKIDPDTVTLANGTQTNVLTMD